MGGKAEDRISKKVLNMASARGPPPEMFPGVAETKPTFQGLETE